MSNQPEQVRPSQTMDEQAKTGVLMEHSLNGPALPEKEREEALAKAAAKRRERRPRWWKPFLAVFEQTGNITAASKAASVSRSAVYAARKNIEEFRLLFEDAEEVAADRLEAEALRRGVEGWEESVFYHGEEVGAIRKYDSQLLLALLKAARPDKFKDRTATELSGSLDGAVKFYLPDDGRNPGAVSDDQQEKPGES